MMMQRAIQLGCALTILQCGLSYGMGSHRHLGVRGGGMRDAAPSLGIAGSTAGTGSGNAADERVITILGTNDIHGGVEPTRRKDGSFVGGMTVWGGVVKSIRDGLAAQYGAKGGVVLVDAGDQFQGTLISNINEGQLVFNAMNEIGYDAAIPGNHDYDFGPIGWEEDQVTETSQDKDPRGALLRLVNQAKFKLISANTYLKGSLVDANGNPVEVNGIGCRAKAGAVINWSTAKRPSFLTPYVLKRVAGIRVALIGIDNSSTPSTTTAANVSDLCFRDEAEAYLDIRTKLERVADVFVMVIHNGNSNTEFAVSDIVQKINAPKNGRKVDAVIAGHTHFTNRLVVNGAPIIQSGSGGTAYGRIDLVWNTALKQIDVQRTRYFAGVTISETACPEFVSSYCKIENGRAVVEGVAVQPNAQVQSLIAQVRDEINPIAHQHLGDADGVISVNRTDESPLANALSDALRNLSGADVAFLNTGGIRASIDPGDVTFEDLFRVLPFNNHAVLMKPMTVQTLVSLVDRSIKTCGSFGALMQSGLRVSFTRDCAKPVDGKDPKAALMEITTVSGDPIYRAGAIVDPKKEFLVATLDFLATGGSGFDDFKEAPVVGDLGIFRKKLTEYFALQPAKFSSKVDGRWKENAPSPAPSPTE